MLSLEGWLQIHIVKKAVYTVSGSLSRKEWGLHSNTASGASGLLLVDEVFIKCGLEFINEDKKTQVILLNTDSVERGSL